MGLVPLKPPPIDGAWPCEYCGRENWGDRLQCEGCGASRPWEVPQAYEAPNLRAGPPLSDPALMSWIVM